MAIVWYVLIHVSLGLIGYRVLDFSNAGVLAAAALSAGVQLWPAWEIHRLAWPRFAASRPAAGSRDERVRETRAYWIRMGRLYAFRISAFTLLTLFVAWLART